MRVYSEKEMKASRGKQDVANNITFMVSALWHGFYPGYFLAFFNWSILSIVAKQCFKTSFNYPSFNYDNIIYKMTKFLVSLTLMNYFGVMFFMLSFDAAW